MQHFSITPVEMVLSLWRNRGLIYASTKREVLGRYRGSVLGVFWSFFNPLLMLAVYTFVFSEVFKARWSPGSDSKSEFALVLFAGMIFFNIFAECISKAPTLILTTPNYVKKVVFPLEILPFVVLLSATYHALISLGVWLCAYLLLVGIPHHTVFLLPVVLFPFGLFVLGLSWALASLGVFIRDLSQFIGVVVTIMMFLSPVFYPATALPESAQNLLYMNPLTPFIETSRDLLYWGKLPDLLIILSYWLFAAVVASLGFAWFQKTRKGFADVL